MVEVSELDFIAEKVASTYIQIRLAVVPSDPENSALTILIW
ncbi:MAG: hypothetical protein RBT74_16925 [Tenuifilaceae bacterium]|jgi:hypothetical protein|nr:hypothetical protein [Tenuifilaceae bacterium]